MDELLRQAVDRIARMEACFDLAQNAEPGDDPRLAGPLAALKEYYEGGQWLRDYELDEKGLLPRELKRGVLSQDGLYDLLAGLGNRD